MIKLVYCITRRPKLSVEEFQRYWRETHGPVTARIPGLRRYVQSHVLPELYQRERLPRYDGVAELWYDDLAAWEAARVSPEHRATIEDERNFIDHSHVSRFSRKRSP
jgi:uncharacterized protein (TIGR02118 family)